MSDNFLKVIVEKLDAQQLELKDIKAKVGELDNKVNNLDNKVEKLDTKVNKLDTKVEKLDKNLDYNTQMTKQTLDYAISVDKIIAISPKNWWYMIKKSFILEKNSEKNSTTNK